MKINFIEAIKKDVLAEAQVLPFATEMPDFRPIECRKFTQRKVAGVRNFAIYCLR